MLQERRFMPSSRVLKSCDGDVDLSKKRIWKIPRSPTPLPSPPLALVHNFISAEAATPAATAGSIVMLMLMIIALGRIG